MPVRFETNSEYNKSFQGPHDTPQLMNPVAGLKSEQIANLNEPKLQSRRKPLDLMRTSTTYQKKMANYQDDYMLVGDQAKFAPSVKYRMPRRWREYNTAATGEDRNGYHPPPRTEYSPPPAPRERDIAPVSKRRPDNYMPRPTKPVYNSHQPPPPPRKDPNAKPPGPKLAFNIRDQEPEVASTNPSKSRPPQPPRKEPAVKTKVPKFKLKEAGDTQPQRKPADPRERRKGKFDEFVQTDLSKGVADSGQEATADYAMKYRAGCPPPRPAGPKRLSEYQMQFQWKKGVGASPMLAAEQIVYNSNPQLAPYSNPDVPPKVSEYKKAFKNYTYKPVPVEFVQPKKAKLQRSKSMEAVTPDRLRAAGVRSGKCTQEDKRLLRESANPTRVLFPHGKVKYVGSEYAMNYRNPMRYSYDDGVWKGADPPHLQPDKTPVPVSTSAIQGLPTRPNSWYKEVVELRDKAEEYKQRARGTHFSREHLAQLYAQQADLWDTVSNNSVLSALSLESARTMTAKNAVSMDVASTCESASDTVAPQPKAMVPKLAWAGDVASTTPSRATSVESLQGSPPGSVGVSTEGSSSSQQGRLSTPKFRKEHDSAGYKWRHHLDRTTPAVGGALLTSPPRHKATNILSKSDSALKIPTSAPKVPVSRSAHVATSGLPTRDTHVLVDEEASTDRPLNTKFTQSPPIGQHAKKHPLGVDVMPTLRETLRELQSNSSAPVDDDVVSLSARSVASSCSLASEVLERARNRRDEFWGPSDKKASRS